MNQVVVFKESENLSPAFQHYIQNITEKEVVIVERNASDEQALLRDLEQVYNLVVNHSIKTKLFSDNYLIINFDDAFEEVYRRDINNLDHIDDLIMLNCFFNKIVIESKDGIVELLKENWLQTIQELAIIDKDKHEKCRQEYFELISKLGGFRDMNEVLFGSQIIICDTSKKDFLFIDKDNNWNKKVRKAKQFKTLYDVKLFIDDNEIELTDSVILYRSSMLHFYTENLAKQIKEKKDEMARLAGYAR
ncbi:hypothetical protein LCA30_02355 [Vibrio harveyi]|uniref:hypothetical protein n=1 Tax=Vibrio harveyi TaxID=669 RepID=UPI003BB6D192